MKKTLSFLFSIMILTLVSWSCSSDDNYSQLETLAEITNFSLSFPGVAQEDVEYTLRTNIVVSVPFGSSLTGVIPHITISDKASVSPASGEVLDFVAGETKSIVVTAEDGHTKEYTLSVIVRNEIGKGSRLKTYTVADLFGENSTSTYSYTGSNFVKEIQKETDDWGSISRSVTTFEYNTHNQIIAKHVASKKETTEYLYQEDVIVQAKHSVDNKLVYTYDYTYNSLGDLQSEKRTNHLNNDSVDEIQFVIEQGNVIEEIRYGNSFVAAYDDKNNPFVGMYPAAFAKIQSAIEQVNVNNPISGTLADDVISYVYNEDDYPVSASYTYFSFLASVEKTFTYYTE